MRGEIGLSTVKSRVARGRVQYMRRVLQGENKMLKGVMMGAKRGRSTWMKETRKNLIWAGIAEEEIAGLTREEVKRRVGWVVDRE